MNCDGCRNENGRLLRFCNDCRIRACGLAKGISDCTGCDQQPCDDLKKFHQFSPKAKAVFEDALKRM